MCNVSYDLEDWLSVPCPICGNAEVEKRRHVFFIDRTGNETLDVPNGVRCPGCHNVLCQECGDKLDLHRLQEDGYRFRAKSLPRRVTELAREEEKLGF